MLLLLPLRFRLRFVPLAAFGLPPLELRRFCILGLRPDNARVSTARGVLLSSVVVSVVLPRGRGYEWLHPVADRSPLPLPPAPVEASSLHDSREELKGWGGRRRRRLVAVRVSIGGSGGGSGAAKL